jgi:hypothetical protein
MTAKKETPNTYVRWYNMYRCPVFGKANRLCVKISYQKNGIYDSGRGYYLTYYPEYIGEYKGEPINSFDCVTNLLFYPAPRQSKTRYEAAKAKMDELIEKEVKSWVRATGSVVDFTRYCKKEFRK